jgi:hypothetical protein
MAQPALPAPTITNSACIGLPSTSLVIPRGVKDRGTRPGAARLVLDAAGNRIVKIVEVT